MSHAEFLVSLGMIMACVLVLVCAVRAWGDLRQVHRRELDEVRRQSANLRKLQTPSKGRK